MNIPYDDFSHSTLAALIEKRLNRRELLKLSAGAGIAALLPRFAAAEALPVAPALNPTSSLTFKEIHKALTTTHQLAEGYKAQILARWGDAVRADAPPFNPRALTAGAQARQFGYNCDYTAYLPLPYGSKSSTHGLLFVNHEYTNLRLMFSGISKDAENDSVTETMSEIEQQAHGYSILEIVRSKGQWQPVKGSLYNRRVTATTPIRLSGAAAGHVRLATKKDPSARMVHGTFGNCAGGVTPWGTVLTAEENINGFFSGKTFTPHETRNHTRMGIGKKTYYGWHRFNRRFNAEKEPHEPNRFGWIVEHDPYDPSFVPVKRTALGRFKHEGATCALAKDGRVVVYSGDDEAFEYLYRFVSRAACHRKNRLANRHILDEGTLYAARFEENGTLRWLPLVYGKAPLDAAHGFHSQADVLIEARSAAELLGATPMDRPEDIEVEPKEGRVYVALTKNAARDSINAANPRTGNAHGHIIELMPPAGDHAAEQFSWDIFIKGGNPDNGADGAAYLNDVSAEGWLSCPDNLAIDPRGRLWIATDGQPESIGKADSMYATELYGATRGATRLFFNAPTGAEITGPSFTPDGKTLFISVQHPADDAGSRFDTPSTRWPDFDTSIPPRPAILAITKKDGGEIGS